jgi:ceramide glucosyltransferase
MQTSISCKFPCEDALDFPHPNTWTHSDDGAVRFLWHFPSTGLEPSLPDVIRHTALRSSDFPPSLRRATVRSGCPHLHYMRWFPRFHARRRKRVCCVRVHSEVILTVGKIAAEVAGAGGLAGIVYYVTVLWSAAEYRQARRPAPAPKNESPMFATPPVSILKPLKGVDPEMSESFRSHCVQDYPEYEIIFGVSDAGDPAVREVERLRAEFPERSIQLVVCSQRLGNNVKVSNLVQMARQASHDHFIVSDSDIRVQPDYLRRVMAPLADPSVGMVTCLYRGVAVGTLGSKLESLGISTDFSPGVLVARLLEGSLHFGLGSTMAFRRSDLEGIGGFESFVDYLGDDYELGRRIAMLGREVHLSDLTVETFLPPYRLMQYFAHQLRWARGVRDSRPGGYLGLLFTFGWQWTVLALIFSAGAGWAWGLAVVAVLLRLISAWVVGAGVLEDCQVVRFFPLILLRDLGGVLIWLASFAGNTVTWRGERYHLKNGKLSPST